MRYLEEAAGIEVPVLRGYVQGRASLCIVLNTRVVVMVVVTRHDVYSMHISYIKHASKFTANGSVSEAASSRSKARTFVLPTLVSNIPHHTTPHHTNKYTDTHLGMYLQIHREGVGFGGGQEEFQGRDVAHLRGRVQGRLPILHQLFCLFVGLYICM